MVIHRENSGTLSRLAGDFALVLPFLHRAGRRAAAPGSFLLIISA